MNETILFRNKEGFGAEGSTMDALAEATAESDKVLIF